MDTIISKRDAAAIACKHERLSVHQGAHSDAAGQPGNATANS